MAKVNYTIDDIAKIIEGQNGILADLAREAEASAAVMDTLTNLPEDTNAAEVGTAAHVVSSTSSTINALAGHLASTTVLMTRCAAILITNDQDRATLLQYAKKAQDGINEVTEEANKSFEQSKAKAGM